MPKQRVVELFVGGGRNVTTINASSAASALQVAQSFYNGSLQVFEETTKVNGSEPDAVLVPFNAVTVLLKNPSAKKSAFVSIKVKATIGEPEIITAFLNKTFNGVKAEDVKITSFVQYQV